MTTETTCLSSIWKTDAVIEEFFEIHGRKEDFEKLSPGETAYYDGMVYVDLDKVEPMIAMPFHPSNAYTIRELNQNLSEILHDVEQKALVSLGGDVNFTLQDKVRNGKLYVEQGIIAGCAGEDLKISVLLLRFFQDAESEQMSLHSVCIRQVHRSTWSW